MTDKQLITFLQVAKEKSFSKVAKANFISVPALVQQMNLLEDSLGFELFIRSNRGVQLTSGGEKFLIACKQIISIYEEAKIEGLKENGSTIRIGVTTDQYPTFLLEACSHFSKDYPNAKLLFINIPFSEQLQAIRKYQIDCAILAKPKADIIKDLTYLHLCDDTLSFAMQKFHRLANQKILTEKDLKDETILCGQYLYLDESFEEQLQNTGANIIPLTKETDIDIKTRVLFSNEMVVCHSCWAKSYQNMLQIIPSNIDGGSVGIVLRPGSKQVLAIFIQYLQQQLK